MTEFSNVTITKAANVYFDGKVTSRTVTFEDGSKKSLGIMMPGDYKFDTVKKERMEILSGELDVQLPGSDEWLSINGGGSFDVPANSTFSLKVKSLTDYCCTYLK